jgi:hypothetical protein
VAKHSDSLRPQHTVLALAEFLAQQIDLGHAKGEENALVADAMARRGNVCSASITFVHQRQLFFPINDNYLIPFW